LRASSVALAERITRDRDETGAAIGYRKRPRNAGSKWQSGRTRQHAAGHRPESWSNERLPRWKSDRAREGGGSERGVSGRSISAQLVALIVPDPDTVSEPPVPMTSALALVPAVMALKAAELFVLVMVVVPAAVATEMPVPAAITCAAVVSLLML